MSECCNSFVLVPKSNGKVRLCLDPAWLNQALIRLIYRGPTLNTYYQNLNNAKYLSLIDMTLGYHNLKPDKKSSYLTVFICQFGRNIYKWLPFGVTPAGDMFQRKVDEIFKDIPNVFGVKDNILFSGYEADVKDQDETVWRVLQRCQQVNLKLNKDNCHLRCTSVPFFGEIILQNGVKVEKQKIKTLMLCKPLFPVY